jgi:hypothetical protein
LSFSPLPRMLRILDSARRAKPMLETAERLEQQLHQRATHVPRTPVCALTDRNSVDTFVHTGETLSAKDIRKHSPRWWWLNTGRCLLMPRDLRCFHTGAETWEINKVSTSAAAYAEAKKGKGAPMVAYACAMPPPIPPNNPAAAGFTPIPMKPDSISEAVNSKTPPFVDASIQAWSCVRILVTKNDSCGTHPWNETLIEAGDASTTPDGFKRLHHGLRAVGGHLGLDDL